MARVQERLGRRILVENVSSYLTYRHSTMSEPEFLTALAERADCGLLLDVNNVFVSARQPRVRSRRLPRRRAARARRAVSPGGAQPLPTHLLDTHDHPVCDDVWELYRHAVARFGDVATLLERDDHIPPLEELCARVAAARACEIASGATTPR